MSETEQVIESTEELEKKAAKELEKQSEKKKRNAAEVAAAIELLKKRGTKVVQKQGTIFKPLSKAQTEAIKRKKGK